MKVNYRNTNSNLQDVENTHKGRIQPKRSSRKNFMEGVFSKAKAFIKDKAKSIKKSAKALFRQIKKDFLAAKSRSSFTPGSLVAMNYKAKDAQKRYDKAPLIICLGWSQNPKLRNTHFYGLNMHWMPMKDRVFVASFFTELLEKRNGKLQYQDIQPFLAKFKGSPVLRMYIYNNVQGKVIKMPTDQFMTAAAVPSEIWMGR